MIFVTVGTQLPFDRLIRILDRIAPDLDEEICVQALHSEYKPMHIHVIDFLAPDEFEDFFSRARLVIAHAGMGTILSAMRSAKPLIVFPRDAALGEHRNDHQKATALMMKEKKAVYVAMDEEELCELLLRKDLHPLRSVGDYAASSLIRSVEEFLDL